MTHGLPGCLLWQGTLNHPAPAQAMLLTGSPSGWCWKAALCPPCSSRDTPSRGLHPVWKVLVYSDTEKCWTFATNETKQSLLLSVFFSAEIPSARTNSHGRCSWKGFKIVLQEQDWPSPCPATERKLWDRRKPKRAPSPTTYTKDRAASSQNPTAEMSSDFTAFLFHQVSRFP